MMRQAGFADAEIAGSTGLDSSPMTRGVLMRARRPSIHSYRNRESAVPDLFKPYDEFFEAVYRDGALDRRSKFLIALGASLAAGCEP